MFKNRDVRWALALLIDIKAVSMASYRGAATISAIGVPPTGTASGVLSRAAARTGCKAFEIDTGKRKIKPYDPTVGKQIADMLRPSMGDQIPTDPTEIAKSFGLGWWKPNPQAAAELLRDAPASPRRAASGSRPTASRSPSSVMVEGEARPVMTRAGTHDRPAMAPVRHRRQDDVGAGHAWSTAAPPAISRR